MTYCCIGQHINAPDAMWCEECESLVVGAIIDSFKVVSYIGTGSFSAVYLAEQQSLNMRKVVIKILQQPWDQTRVDHFQREAALLASLSHPYILPIYAYGIIYGRQGSARGTSGFQARTVYPYLVLPYAEQGSIAETFMRQGRRPWPLDRVVSLTQDVAEALDYAHGRGVLHRDVKPANLLQMGSHVVLSDFSVASMIDVNRSHLHAPWVGSPAYMAPEVWSLVPGRYSDQYALGVTCFYLLTGAYPLGGSSESNVRDWQNLHRNVAPCPLHEFRLDLPGNVGLVLQRALAKDPHERYPTLEAFTADLLAASREEIQNAIQSPALVSGDAAAALHLLPQEVNTEEKEWREAVLFNLLICILLAAEAAWQSGAISAAGNVFLALWPALLVSVGVARIFHPLRSNTLSWRICRGALFGLTDVVLSALVCYAWTALALTIPHWGNDWLQSGDGMRIFIEQFKLLLPEFLKLFVLGSWVAVMGGVLIGLFSGHSQGGRPQGSPLQWQ